MMKDVNIDLEMFQVSLWGNQCDLSISGGAEHSQQTDVFSVLDSLRSNIIVNDSSALWQLMVSLPEDQRDIGKICNTTSNLLQFIQFHSCEAY